MHRIAVVVGSILCVTACISCQRNSEPANSYFDSLVVAQVAQLTRTNASLKKQVSLDGSRDQVTFRPDSTTWENELGIFRQLSSFQRPAYSFQYDVVDGSPDPASNLLVRRYHTNHAVPIPDLRFYYFAQFRNIKAIVARYHQSNILYSTTRHLRMEFDDVAGRPVLSSYRIEEAQKMILGDSVRILIQAEITREQD